MAKFYWATPELVQKAITTSLEAKKEWEKVPIQDRMDLFLKVADQMAGQYRAQLNATTMLGQAKTVIQVRLLNRMIEAYSDSLIPFSDQAEIDSAAELIDFFRFNCYFGKELLHYQPISENPEATLNLMRYRSLEGFVASISPFNFTAIAGNLAYTPAIMVRNKMRNLATDRETFLCFRVTASCGSQATPLCSPTTKSTRSSATPASQMASSTSCPPTAPSSARPSPATTSWPLSTSPAQSRE